MIFHSPFNFGNDLRTPTEAPREGLTEYAVKCPAAGKRKTGPGCSYLYNSDNNKPTCCCSGTSYPPTPPEPEFIFDLNSILSPIARSPSSPQTKVLTGLFFVQLT